MPAEDARHVVHGQLQLLPLMQLLLFLEEEAAHLSNEALHARNCLHHRLQLGQAQLDLGYIVDIQLATHRLKSVLHYLAMKRLLTNKIIEFN